MKKISGYLLVILGILHVSLGAISGWQQIKSIFSYDVWNALGQQPQAICMKDIPCLQVNTIWWIILFGLMLVLFGVLCIWIEGKLQRTIPSFIGWLLLVISGVSAVLLPVSGFWLVMLVAFYMLISNYLAQKKSVLQ